MVSTLEAVALDAVKPQFSRDNWTYLGQVKVERVSVGSSFSHAGSPDLIAAVKEADLNEWAVSGQTNKNFITTDGKRLFRVASTSFLEGTVLIFDLA